MPIKRAMKGKRIVVTLYADPPAYQALKQLSDETRVPMAVYLREAIDDLLAKYKVKVQGTRRAKR